MSYSYSASSESLSSNDRLRKAIERNRRKQAAKASRETGPTKEKSEKIANKPSIFEKRFMQRRAQMQSESKVERRSVPSAPAEIEFTNVRSQPLTKRSKPKYVKKMKRKRKGPTKLGRFFYNASWFFCLFLLLKLVFGQNGVVDYVQRERLLEAKQLQFEELVDESVQLVKQIERIRTDYVYQKKMAREYLGVISADEYLIVFAEERGLLAN